jgi:hypothetical protein
VKANLRAVRVSTCRGFPVNQAAHAIYLTDCIEIGNKFAASCQSLKKFDLEVLAWVGDPNPIVLCKSLQQMDSLMHESIPSLSFLEIEGVSR